ncbi:MAG: ATP synthase F1 subunit delta [Longimonas sp.]|uniref:ATP synthase F1 subunit delta n=1 Tax=Longimonas sp. TaxID=2039626 RepID=UPI00335E520F
MSQRAVATRYASALIEEATANDRIDTIDDDMALLQRSIEENNELARFFKSPVLSADQKNRVLGSLFDDRVDELTLRFLKLLARKKRLTLIDEMLSVYRSIRNEQEGIVEAHVRISHEMDDEETRMLTQALETMTDATIRMEVTVDPSLIGGLVVKIGDQVYDGSVHHKLEALRDRFHTNAHLTATA